MREKDLNAEFVIVVSQVEQDLRNLRGKVDMKSRK